MDTKSILKYYEDQDAKKEATQKELASKIYAVLESVGVTTYNNAVSTLEMVIARLGKDCEIKK